MIAQEKSIFILEELNAAWLDIIRKRRLFGWVVGALLCIFTALIVGTILEWYIDVSMNLKAGYWIGVGIGIVTGLVSGIRSARGQTEMQTERIAWSWKKARRGVLSGFILSIALGPGFLCLLAVIWSGNSLINWFILLLFYPFLIVVGGLSGLFFGLERLTLEDRTFPNQGIKRSLQNSLSVALLGGFVFGLLGGLIYGFLLYLPLKDLDALKVGLSLGAVSSAVIALFLWLFFGGYVVCVHYLIRVMLYRQGAMPMNYVHFLDYATERIFLRRVGGGYIFVHRLLMEHFADMYPEPSD